MSNTGPHSNTSLFGITFGRAQWLDGYNQVFGELVNGEEVLQKLESLGT